MRALVTAKVDALTIWNVHVDGELYNAFDREVGFNDMLMCCYFNIGIDSEIGISNFPFNILLL